MKIELDTDEVEEIIKAHILTMTTLAKGQEIKSVSLGSSYGRNTIVDIGRFEIPEPASDVPYEMPAHQDPTPPPPMQPKAPASAPSGDEIF